MRKQKSPFYLQFYCLFLLLFSTFSCTDFTSNNKLDLITKEGNHFLNQVNPLSDSLTYEEKIEYLNISLSCFEEAENWEKYVDAMNMISVIHYYKESFQLEQENRTRTIEFIRERQDTFSLQYATVLYSFGLFYSKKNQFRKAIDFYQRSLTIEKDLPDTDNFSLSYTYNAMGNLYLLLGDFKNAHKNFIRAINLVETSKGNNHENLAPYKSDLARNFKAQGENGKAKKHFQYSLDIISNQPDSLIREGHALKRIELSNYQHLAEIYLKEKKYTQVDLFLAKAMQIQENYSNLFEDHLTYQLLGKRLLIENKFKKAIYAFEDAECYLIDELEGARKDPKMARLLNEKATAYLQQQKYALAIETYQKAIKAICKTYDNKDRYSNPEASDFFNKYTALEVLYKKAKALEMFYEQSKQLKFLIAANDTYQLINEINHLVRRDFVEEKSKFFLAEEIVKNYKRAILNCMTLYHLTNDKQYLEQAFVFVEGNKAIALQESIQEKEARVSSNIPKKEIQQLTNTRREIAFYEQKIYAAESKPTPNEIEKIKTWKKERNEKFELASELERQLEKKYPKYYDTKYAKTTITIKEVQTELEDDTALIEYFISNDKIITFCITKDDIFIFENSETTLVKNTVQNLLETIKVNNSDINDFSSSAFILYQTILEDVVNKLEKNINQLIIIPDAELYSIPFDVLLTKPVEEKKKYPFSIKNLSYLLEKYAVSYNYSSVMMLKTKRKKNITTNNVFLGIAPFTSSEELPNSKKELDAILNNIGIESNTILIDAEATIENIKEIFINYSIIHFSTHGYMNEENYKLSNIQLYKGILTNYDIENLDINASLVALVACDSNNGKTIKSEGVMSLARSFFIAGAPSLLATLWKINDKEVPEIMKYYYGHLQNSYPKNIALQKAKIDFLTANINNGTDSNPYYWSAFVQIGNTMPLDQLNQKYSKAN